ncbi:phosphotransferase [Isoptericola sp. F-RaC21]|uniref:phosphotransferase n=1 Tax=Isoptericola sp. F-RaC21 TaxID=3141452 RepID=UPI00315BD19E
MDLIAAGRDADVFALDERRVLRRYRDGRPAEQDAVLLAAVRAAGYPAPAVLDVDGPALVLERLTGPTLGAALFDGTCDVAEAGPLLASLHDRLHAVPWQGGSLLHLDLHPFNVIMSARGPVVIDWTDARPGPAPLDVAMTALTFALSALEPASATVGGASADEVAPLARGLLAAFVAACDPEYRDHLTAAVELRRVNPAMSAAEVGRLDEAAALAACPA